MLKAAAGEAQSKTGVDRFLAGEMLVQGALGDAGPGSKLGNGYFLPTAFAEKGKCRVE